jgi:hypothetical protein
MQAVLILINCISCRTKNRIVISSDQSTPPKCGKCGFYFFEQFAVISGYVYILSNPGMPDLLKIGQTSGTLQNRIDQLSSATGVPNPFVLEAYFFCKDPKADENLVHETLKDFRRPGREFFKIPLQEALAYCENALGRPAQYRRLF